MKLKSSCPMCFGEYELNHSACLCCVFGIVCQKERDKSEQEKKIDYESVTIQKTSRGILSFVLPDDQNSFEIAVKSIDFALAWNDVLENIRQELKYKELSKERAKAFEDLREFMNCVASERNLPELR